MALLNIQPREYQQKIFETAKENNTLVVLPTGLGKTLIALLLAIERKKSFPLSKVVFLAPTRPLIEQHFNYFKKYLPELFAEMELFTGQVEAEKRKKIWQTAEIIFSTPQCVANDLENGLYDLKDVSLLVIDEAHRCLKNYDYTKVVKTYKEQAQNQRILGLTASPGHEPDKIRQICKHLDIEEIELRTRDSEDVRPYLQKLDFEKVEVPFPSEMMEIRALLKKIFDQKAEKIKNMFPNLTPVNKITLLKLQGSLASQMSGRNFHAMIGMSLTAQAIKIAHALELLETQTLSGLKEYLINLKKQATEKKTKAAQSLVKSPEFALAFTLLEKLLQKEMEHPKIEELAVLMENEIKAAPKAKFIVFAQFRDTLATIMKRLSKIPTIKPSIFIGQAKKSSSAGISGMSQKEQRTIIEKFKAGEINSLICTSIGEEGLDLPEVNAVIFYEPIPSAIRKIQRQGRTARLAPGKLIILVTKDTRDVIHHYASSARERKMHKTIDMVKKELQEKKKTPTLASFVDTQPYNREQ
jgi:Fanconi anemia group M protein